MYNAHITLRLSIHLGASVPHNYQGSDFDSMIGIAHNTRIGLDHPAGGFCFLEPVVVSVGPG